MERLPREFVRRRSRECSALRRMWMGVFAVLTVVSISTRRSPGTNSHSPARLCPSSRCTEPITSFRYRLVDDETKPDLPLREASGSLSINLNLDHEPRELLSSTPSRETSLPSLPTSLTVNCEQLLTPGD